MIYSITPQKTATLYSKYPTQNTGRDEIIEITKTIEDSVNYNSRILIKFKTADIEALPTGSSEYYLKLYETEPTEVPREYTIYAYAVSQSWDQGVGTISNDPINEQGVSWNWRNWNSGSAWTIEGGTYFTSSAYVMSQSYVDESTDIYMNISNIVYSWNADTIINEGIILKRDANAEGNNGTYGSLKYFSKETNTIYKPKLEVRWDDVSWITGSLNELTSSQIDVFVKYLEKEYNNESRVKLRVEGRPSFVQKTYTTSFTSASVHYLPTSSYYSIWDAHTDEVVIPFNDNFTKISCDNSGNYFNLWMEQFEVDRYYKIKFKVVNNNGTNYYDNKYIFKVVE